jgi:hypothetical protein
LFNFLSQAVTPHLYRAELKNQWSCTSIPPISFHGVDREGFASFNISYTQKISFPITGPNRPTGFQEVKAPRFLDMKVVGCQPYAPAAFTPWINLVIILRV